MIDLIALPASVVWAMNVGSSVGIILVNKTVLSTYAFKFATTLTAFHFVCTASVGYIAILSGLLKHRKLPFFTLFWFSIVANMATISMNLSLMLNSVGFYQISKLSIIPVCCLLEFILNAKTFSRNVRFAVAIVMVGVGICTVTDVSVNAAGFLAAVVAVLSTTIQQVLVGSLQKHHNISSFGLLSQIAPIQALQLVIVGPFADYILIGQNVFYYEASFPAVSFIGLSCLLALFVNLSTYLCIGKFSAVSFQVLGHMKTLLVLTLGWLFFHSVVTLKNIGGMSIAVMGMILYSWAVEKEKIRAEEAKKMSDTAPPKPNNFTETDSLLAEEDPSEVRSDKQHNV